MAMFPTTGETEQKEGETPNTDRKANSDNWENPRGELQNSYTWRLDLYIQLHHASRIGYLHPILQLQSAHP